MINRACYFYWEANVMARISILHSGWFRALFIIVCVVAGVYLMFLGTNTPSYLGETPVHELPVSFWIFLLLGFLLWTLAYLAFVFWVSRRQSGNWGTGLGLAAAGTIYLLWRVLDSSSHPWDGRTVEIIMLPGWMVASGLILSGLAYFARRRQARQVSPDG